MTVKELKEIINLIPEELNDRIVILQKDPEGNDYREMRGMDEIGSFWHEEDRNVVDENYFENREEFEEFLENYESKLKPCIVIYP